MTYDLCKDAGHQDYGLIISFLFHLSSSLHSPDPLFGHGQKHSFYIRGIESLSRTLYRLSTQTKSSHFGVAVFELKRDSGKSTRSNHLLRRRTECIIVSKCVGKVKLPSEKANEVYNRFKNTLTTSNHILRMWSGCDFVPEQVSFEIASKACFV